MNHISNHHRQRFNLFHHEIEKAVFRATLLSIKEKSIFWKWFQLYRNQHPKQLESILKLFKTVALSAWIVTLCGCTSIQVTGAGRVNQTSFGVLKIEVPQKAKFVAYELEGFGVIPGRNGISVGYKRETVALVYDRNDCRIVIFELPDNQFDAELWKSILGQSKDVCFIGENQNEQYSKGD